MLEKSRPTPASLVRTYFQAKDGNRPYLMARAFAETASLEMVVKTDAISFPSLTQGVAGITDVLVSKFGQTYENVYSFCLRTPPDVPAKRFSCKWLVGMSEKQSGNVRIGCGRYDWTFQTEAPFLVEHLRITIGVMQVLPAEHLPILMDWIGGLPYPWCPAAVVFTGAPRVPGLVPVLKYVGRAPTHIE